MIKGAAKLINALNGNVKKTQIAAGFSWGLLLGLVPVGNAFWITLFFISFFFRHNHGAKISALAFVKIISPLFIYQLHALGEFILVDIQSLQPLFTTMYNMPFVPFTKFNNTLVMGGLSAGLLLYLPVFISLILFIPFYRNYIAPKIRNSKFVKTISRLPLLSLIDKSLKG